MKQIDSLQTDKKFKKTEIGEIPVDWEVRKLSAVAKIKMGQSPPSSNCFDYENGIPFFQGKAEFGSIYPNINKWCNSPKQIAEEGDILVSVRAPVGDVNIALQRCCIGRGLARIRGIIIDNHFLYFIMNCFKKVLQKISQGSTFEAINKDVLHNLKIPFPPLPEQKKIAEILLALDELIEKKVKIIEKKKQLKKGLLQQLLTRGIGHAEFKKTEIGEIPVDLEVVKLKSIVNNFINGGTPSTNNHSYWDGTIPWITGADFDNQKIRRIRKYLTEEGIKNSSTNIIQKGSLLVVTRTGVGKIAISPFNIAISQDITGLILLGEKVYTEYLYWYLIKNSQKIQSFIQGTSINGLPREDLESIIIPLPHLPEQKKSLLYYAPLITISKKRLHIKRGWIQLRRV